MHFLIFQMMLYEATSIWSSMQAAKPASSPGVSARATDLFSKTSLKLHPVLAMCGKNIPDS